MFGLQVKFCSLIYILIQGTYTKRCDQCYCGPYNRYAGQESKTLEDCKNICNADEKCKGVEHWAGGSMLCFRCSDPDQTSAFTDSGYNWFPPSVYKKDNGPL